MLILIIELVVSVLVILLGCELFANSVENIGKKLGLAHQTAGSLLAAVGTALPETTIPIMALILGGGEGGRDRHWSHLAPPPSYLPC